VNDILGQIDGKTQCSEKTQQQEHLNAGFLFGHYCCFVGCFNEKGYLNPMLDQVFPKV
jgi:hypothetical protein